ncbi:MAG: bifunctional 4-hydroxy-2-oxoglutarate aldolase/2-dehydro-3-deoxy-phosphogluconate aldolase [Opitutus sp.]
MTKDALLAQIHADRVIGLVNGDLGDQLIACAGALADGGIHFLEVAMTTPAALKGLEVACARLPDFRFGLGTVLDVETARLGILAGVSFIATPAPRPDVITTCRRFQVPVFSGAFTREDIRTAHHAGADAIKVFPREQFGPAYIKTLAAELPGILLFPIGGVTPTTIAEFLRAGAAAAYAGTSLLEQSALDRADWASISATSSRFREAVTTHSNLKQ